MEWDRERQRGREGKDAEVEAPSAEEQAHELRVRVARHKRMVQRKAVRDGATQAAIPQTTGAPLPAAARQRMEPQLGADLSAVRVHTGSESAAAATSLGARAFTDGSDVHFAAGEFAPGTKEGDRLLAHELTHTVQAQRSGIQRKANGAENHGGHKPEGLEVSQPGDAAETEADAVADHAAGALHGDGAEQGGAGPDAGKEKAPQIGAKLSQSVVLTKKDDGKKEEPVKGKPVNLPAWKDVIIDVAHITSGHVAGGARASAKKDKFPPGMTPQKIESVVRNAYKVCKKLQTQGDRVLVVGTADGLTIEMWVNTTTKTIETAYPQY